MIFIANVIAALIIMIIFIYVYKEAYGTTVYYFYDENCSNCVRMNPEWQKFSEGTNFNMIKPIKVDVTDLANRELADSFGISAIPTIFKVKDNIRYEYKGVRTSAEISSWSQ